MLAGFFFLPKPQIWSLLVTAIHIEHWVHFHNFDLTSQIRSYICSNSCFRPLLSILKFHQYERTKIFIIPRGKHRGSGQQLDDIGIYTSVNRHICNIDGIHHNWPLYGLFWNTSLRLVVAANYLNIINCIIFQSI